MFCSDLGYPWGGLKLWGRTTLFGRYIYLWFWIWRCLYVLIKWLNKLGSLILGWQCSSLFWKVFLPVSSHTRCLSLLPFWPRGIRHYRPLFRSLHLKSDKLLIFAEVWFQHAHDGHEKLWYWCRSSSSDSLENLIMEWVWSPAPSCFGASPVTNR